MSPRIRAGATAAAAPRFGSIRNRKLYAALFVALLPLASCADESPMGPVVDPVEPVEPAPLAASFPSPGGVDDLAVGSIGTTSITLTWTQVDDGTGRPASYRVKHAAPPVDWKSAEVGCAGTIAGSEVGAELSCTVEGLEPGKSHDFLLMSFGIDGTEWTGARYSNIVTASTGTEDDGPVVPPMGGQVSDGIWIDRDELMRLPVSGPAWERVLADAAGASSGSADIADQDSNHDVHTLAAALVCVRTGESCDDAREAVVDAIGTEQGARWLAVGRNLGAYVIAADLLDLRADGDPASAGSRVEAWMEGWLTVELSDNNERVLREFGPFHSSANAAAQEGFAYAAVAAYLGDEWALRRAWDAFRTFACDPDAPDREGIDLERPVRDGWTHDDRVPCAINPAGARRPVPSGRTGAGTSHRIDGALVGDMRRGGIYQWEPGYTQYVWVGLEGIVPAAVILERVGYPAFEVADRAVLRTHEYLWHLRSETGDERWFDGDRAREIVHLVNTYYDVSFPVNGAAGGGRTVGYTDWTHVR